MTAAIQRLLAFGGFVCILSLTLACRHKAVTNSVPANTPTPAQLASMEPDQLNTEGWDKAWTNLLNVAEKSRHPTGYVCSGASGLLHSSSANAW